jgi:hypothetical protein
MLMFWIYLPLAALGFPPEWFVVSMGLNLLYQFWIHTELIGTLGPLEWILNTPSHHRVHHGRNPKYIDKNHAGVFILWDRLFGTFQKEEERPTYGITRNLHSFNPVWAHVKPYAELWQETRRMPTWIDKIRFLFAPPGWYPASLGGYKRAPEVQEHETKFDVALPKAINLYLLVQYAFVVAIGAVFLMNLAVYSNTQKAVFLIFMLYQVFATGSVFDQTKRARMIESVRLCLLSLFGIWVALNLQNTYYAGFVIVCSLLGIAWFIILLTGGYWNKK